MKSVFYLLILFFIGTLVYNLFAIDWRMNFWIEQNRPYVYGIAAGVLGLILTLIFLRYQDLRKRVEK